MSILVLGAEATPNTAAQANTLIATRQLALVTGTLNELRTFNGAVGNAKAGIYADSSGSPGALLSVNNSGTYLGAGGWFPVPIPSIRIVEGEYYWIVFLADTAGNIRRLTFGSETNRWESVTYASGIPDPMSPDGSNSWYYSLVGYGPSGVSAPMLGGGL